MQLVAFSWGIPQWIVLVIYSLAYLGCFITPNLDKSGRVYSFLQLSFMLVLLYWGGFWA